MGERFSSRTINPEQTKNKIVEILKLRFVSKVKTLYGNGIIFYQN